MSRKLIRELNDDNFEELLLTLAWKKGMTIKEIQSKMQKDNPIVKSMIQKLSMDCSCYSNHHLSTEGYKIDIENDRLRYIDFLQHCLIFYYDYDGERYYHISLFGILFLMKMLREKDRYPFPRGREIPFEKKLDVFASTDPKKLPLIFNKWSQLKKYFNLLSIYNFEFVLYDIQELWDMEVDVAKDYGLIQDVYPMYVSNNKKCKNILDTGTRTLRDIINNNFNSLYMFNFGEDDDITEIINVIRSWERYLDFRKKFLNIEASIDGIFDEIRSHKLKKSGPNTRQNPLHCDEDRPLPFGILEKALEDEVTLTYYLKLVESNSQPLVIEDEYRLASSMAQLVEENPRIGLNPFSPRERLKIMIAEDREVRDLTDRFMKDSSKYRGEELEKIKMLSDSLNIQPKI